MSEPLNCGERLKLLREANNLSVRALAERANCSPGFISLLEKNHSSPTVAMLTRICEALGTTVSDFLKPSPERNEPYVMRSKDQEFTVVKRWKRARLSMFIPTTVQNQFTALMLEIEPGGNTLPLRATRFTTNELGVVLKGLVQLEMDGQFHSLKMRESAYFNLKHPHAWHNLGNTDAQILLVNPNSGNLLEDL